MTALLAIDNLSARVGEKPILKGLSLAIQPGEVHAIMGPNGSGKSTLANLLAGKPGYEVTSGTVQFNGTDLLSQEAEERSHAGLFLAFQYPVEIPGVSNMEFLKAALDQHAAARGEDAPATGAFIKRVRELANELDLNAEFLKRGVNEGFSGGEKKRNEILQLRLLEPTLAVLDETDSGLDIDALRVVGEGVNAFRSPTNGVLMITHYQRLLDHIRPNFVHVLSDGQIIRTGGPELALELEEKGYGWLAA
ncbi:MAG: Fe-S cluster assembly ATPase SufC [Pseudomonadota bacterium]